MTEQRFSLSTTDVLLIVVVAALLRSHVTQALTGDIAALLFAVQHATLIVCTLLHRPSLPSCPPPFSVALAWIGTLLPLTMQPNTSALTTWFGTSIIALGSSLATVAILSLGRSFGLEPAHRGVQTRGLYRVVRHPIYAAYIPIVGGFALTHPSLWNAIVAALWLGVQVARIQREEALLKDDPHYLVYSLRVRYRLIPLIW